MLVVPFALFSQFYNSQAFELRFGGHIFIISEEEMSQDKKTVAETKPTEEEKLLEEKTARFVESIAKKIQRRLLKRHWKACLKILMIATAMM